MKVPATALGLAFVLLTASQITNASSGVLKILTYNIEGMRPGSDPPTRLSFIIQNLRRIDPDIIGLQEINETKGGGGADNQARVIAESLSAHFGVPYSFYSQSTHEAWDGQFIESIGIVTKHPVLNSGFRDLQPAEFPRKVVWNLIETPLGRVNFFTTHLSNTNGTARVIQANQVKDYVLLQESSSGSSAAILTGDFNDDPESSTLQVFTGNNQNAWYFDTFWYANPGIPGFTIDASAPSRRIDFILYKRDGEFPIESSVLEMDVPYSPGKFCSDHLAVLTTLSMGRLIAPAKVEFPSVLIGSADTAKFVIGNWGTRPVIIHSVESGSGPFRILGNPSMPVTLPTKDSSLRLDLMFSPYAIGLVSDSVTVHSDDPVHPVVKVAVRGRGIGHVTQAQVGRCYAFSSTAWNSELWTLSLAAGEALPIAATDIASVSAISIRPSTGELLAVSAGESESILYRVSADSGYCVRVRTLPIGGIRTMGVGRGDTLLVGTMDGAVYRTSLVGSPPVQLARVQVGFGVGALCYDPPSEQFWLTLYAWPFTNDSLFILNPRSGEITLRGRSGQVIVTSALAVDTSGVLYGLTGTTLNLLERFDRATGSSELVTFDAYQNFVGLGVRWPLSASTVSSQHAGVPASFELSQNYPNPFNPTTKIQFTIVSTRLPQKEENGGQGQLTIVKVFDVLGREVATLVNEVKEPGTHTVEFNASALASGVYYYRLQTGGSVAVKEMLLVR